MISDRSYKVLLAPHVSEKSTLLAEKAKQYVFRVATDSTKAQIKVAVQDIYKVEVKSVQVINMRGKTTRFGRIAGRRKNWKKAYVSLKEGHDINFSEGA